MTAVSHSRRCALMNAYFSRIPCDLRRLPMGPPPVLTTPPKVSVKPWEVQPVSFSSANLGAVEEWKIYNFTEDAHPVHLHLVRFEVVSRMLLDGTASPNASQQPWERGRKDVVIAYPGEITTVRAKFDIDGLYMWHCHILEHEDNEMMRPYVVEAQSLAFNGMTIGLNDRPHHEGMRLDNQKAQ